MGKPWSTIWSILLPSNGHYELMLNFIVKQHISLCLRHFFKNNETTGESRLCVDISLRAQQRPSVSYTASLMSSVGNKEGPCYVKDPNYPARSTDICCSLLFGPYREIISCIATHKNAVFSFLK